jgi:hypothetical protein
VLVWAERSFGFQGYWVKNSPESKYAWQHEMLGWPALAMCQTRRPKPQSLLPPTDEELLATYRGALALPRWAGPTRTAWATPVLPASVLWQGFAINVGFYAAAVYGGCKTWLLVRSTLRRRRGQCPACGYSRRGLPDAEAKCPECGA